MNDFVRITASLLTFLTFTGCVTFPDHLKTPSGKERGILGVSITQEAPIGIFSNDPDVIHLVKVQGKGPLHEMPVVHSNFAKDGNLYLIDAEPGTYAVIGASWSKTSAAAVKSDFHSSYDVDTINALTVEVKPGSLAYIGKVVIKDGTSPTDSKSLPSFDQLLSAMAHRIHYFGKLESIDKTPASKEQFLRRAQQHFTDTGWTAALK